METTVSRLADLIDYQRGAVVSRQLLKEKTGNVTLFAFDGGEGLAEHTSPFAALVQGVEGEATITIGSTSHHLSAGDILHLPADIPHGIRTEKPFKMLLTMIRAPHA
ncbi:MAG TPA: cupin domain-containing protein [Candidatus Xenobia bacterium]|jgi:quercetin dioxygenase-like cupin family protein